MVFFQLLHLYDGHSPQDLGYYSSILNIQEAQNVLNKKQGFSDSKDGYVIIQRSSHHVSADEPFYEAIIYYHSIDYSVEYSSTLGYFSKETLAQQAIEEFKTVNPSEIPKMVCELVINKCILNKILWSDGFCCD